MSYDLDLFIPQPDTDPITTIEQSALHTDSALHTFNLRLLDILQNDNADFDIQKSDAAIDLIEQIHGIKIGLYHSGAQINIPYWHTEEMTQRLVFGFVKRTLRLIQREMGYAVYDSQLGRVVNVEQDINTIIESYRRVIADMASFYSNI